MCFSAGASFGAGAALSIIGAVTVIKAKTIPQGLFAIIPFIFSIQQVVEGMLWLSLNNTDFPGQSFFTYFFLITAIMVWPVWIPLTIRLLEKDVKRKKILTFMLIIGAVVSAGFGCILVLCPPLAVNTHHHIHYDLDLPPAIKNLIWFFDILYLMATIASTFVSSIKRMKWLGIGFAVSYLFAVLYYDGFVVSVWCYFAAILSIVVLWILSGLQANKQ
jgi:hypothetical protein